MFGYKVNGYFIAAATLLLVFIKLLIIYYLILNAPVLFGYGNDTNSYNSYALGLTDGASNLWFIILRDLNHLGLYSRNGVRFCLIFIGSLIIPFLVAYISRETNTRMSKRVFWFVFLVVSAYPTLFYYSLDIYRDAFMLLSFLVGLWCFKSFLISRSAMNNALRVLFLMFMSYILFLFRPYLGFGFFMALLMCRFFSFSRLNGYVFFSYLISLNVIFLLGYLKPIMDYRAIFINMAGGSNLGIVFDSPVLFIPKLMQNFLIQMCGVYYSGVASIVAFAIESIPFIVGLTFLIRNKKYANKFVDFLVLFFVIYSTIWLLGNDNLGTAVRLRMFSYISVLIACMVVYQNKRLHENTMGIIGK